MIDQTDQTDQPAKEETLDIESADESTLNDFEAFDLAPEIMKALAKLKFTKATPVQKACIPVLLEKETDIVALAKTGTGKTAAYGIPLVEKIIPGSGLHTLVLCPTRELAQQVAINLKNFGEFKKIKVTTVVGGESYDKQIRALRNEPEILVSTPGRLIDLMEQKIVKLESVKYLVLDEADEMLSFGFKEALETIWKATAKQDLKTWLFSATMSRDIRSLAVKYLKNAHEVTLNKTGDEKINVESFACVIFEEDKEDALSLLIKNTPEFYGIIFATTKKQVADLEVKLRGLGLDVDSLHGDKAQADRTRTVERMKSKRTKILVATDVAARGLDIQDLTHVVNFEIPWDVETYTHRIGRTARAGKAGIVWTMVKPKESPKLVRFERALGNKFKNLRIPLVEEVQVGQKINWLKQIAERKIRESDSLRFEKAISSLEGSALAELSTETKQWLAKAFDFFGQGEELRMKQPRSLELRERSDDGYTNERSSGGYDRGGGYGNNRGYSNDRGGGYGGGGRSYGGNRSSGSAHSGGYGGGRWSKRGPDQASAGSAHSFDDSRSSDRSSDRPADRSSDRGESRGFRGGRPGGFGRRPAREGSSDSASSAPRSDRRPRY